MIRLISRNLFGLLIFCAFAAAAPAQQTQAQDQNQNQASANKQNIWVVAYFQEVNSASPIIGVATMPIHLAQTVVEAIPQDVKKDSQTVGFDIDLIRKTVMAMPNDQTFELTENDYNLVIRKFVPESLPSGNASTLIVNTQDVRIPLPLTLSDAAIGMLQYTFEELRGMDEQLRRVMQELRNVPPGELVVGKDYFSETWMRVRLE